MEIVFALLPLSLILALCGLGAYLWSVRSGQYDDLEGDGMRLLADEDCAKRAPERSAERDQN